jgi:hypothetical protein
MLFVLKKNEKLRICVDYKKFNDIIIKNRYIIIIHTPYYLRYTVLLLSLSYRKPSNGENYTLRYYYALTASTSYNRRSLVNLFILT